MSDILGTLFSAFDGLLQQKEEERQNMTKVIFKFIEQAILKFIEENGYSKFNADLPINFMNIMGSVVKSLNEKTTGEYGFLLTEKVKLNNSKLPAKVEKFDLFSINNNAESRELENILTLYFMDKIYAQITVLEKANKVSVKNTKFF
jgi:hypothetical protein